VTAIPSRPVAHGVGGHDHDRALEQLNRLATELDRAHPGAGACLREGMEETLTVIRLGITGKLKHTL
jgi:putative transposase